MFGDEPILGYKEIRIDSKGRIFIPKFTGVEVGDKISIIENGYGSLKLYNLLYMQSIINDLNKRCNSQDMQRIQLLNDRLQLLYYSYLATNSIDSQKRLNVPDQILREYGFKDKVYMQGCGTNLVIHNSKESYDAYVKKLRAK